MYGKGCSERRVAGTKAICLEIIKNMRGTKENPVCQKYCEWKEHGRIENGDTIRGQATNGPIDIFKDMCF